MSCERYFNIMAYTGTMCRCNFLTKKIANIFTWTAVWIIATCLSMPILINSRIIQVREQIQCKVTWEYVPKDICEDQVYSQLISIDETMRTNITNCSQSGLSKCSLGPVPMTHSRSISGFTSGQTWNWHLSKTFQLLSAFTGQFYFSSVSLSQFWSHCVLIPVFCTMFARSKMLWTNKAIAAKITKSK